MRLFTTSCFSLAAAALTATAGVAAAQQQFVPSTTLRAPAYPFVSGNGSVRTAAGDLDGDGDQDIVVGIDSSTGSANRLRLIRNGELDPVTGTHEAYGAFVEIPGALATSDRIFDVEIFDADGDGDNDVVYVTLTVSGAGTFSQVALLRQISPGVFTTPVGIFGTSSSTPVTAEVADLNGDGRMDLVLGTAALSGGGGQGPIILTQSGFGFQATALPPAFAGMTSTSIAIADIEGDGDLDIVAGNRSAQGSSQQNVLYRNVGGSFSPAPAGALPLNGTDTADVLLADFFGTGLPELVVVNTLGATRVFTNNGGVFSSAPGLPSTNSGGGQAAAADVDLDGDLDLAVSYAGANTQIFINSGASLASTPSRLTPDGAASSITFVDVDRDGDADLLRGTPFVQFGSNYRVQINLHRQIDGFRSAPRGSIYTFDYYDRPGYTTGMTPTAMLSTGNLVPRFTLVPFGDFGIDPNGTVINATLAPVSQSMSTLTLTLPVQGLNPGDTWYWQWFHTPSGGLPTDGRLTNVLPLRFL